MRRPPGGFVIVAAAAAMIWLAGAAAASAKTITVGEGQQYAKPSEAARNAADGDTIEIAEGEYYDCAIWNANRLTIVGMGKGATVTDTTCQGKALFVTVGHDITIRNLTLARARVPDGNGAGIRVEGNNLTIEHSRFINNESGILAADAPDSSIVIRDSEFGQNGKCSDARCAHGVYVNGLRLLRIERSRFWGTKAGDAIKSRAQRTELVGNEIGDGEGGTAAYLVELPSGGSLMMEGNTLEKRIPANRGAAVMLGSEYLTQASDELSFANNRVISGQGALAVFVLNWSGGSPAFSHNDLPAAVAEVSDDGAWWHRLRAAVGEMRDGLKDEIRHAAGSIKRSLFPTPR